MSAPGWYPDPGGQAGMFRYWTGSTWSAALSRDPNAAAPGAGLGAPAGQTGGFQSGTGYAPGGFQQGQPSFGQPGYVPGQAYAASEQRKRPVGAWVLLGVGLLVLALVGFFVIRGVMGGGSVVPGGGGTTNPGGQGTTNPCPVNKGAASAVAHPNDGRVYGGQLSYPRLGSPWGAPQRDNRLAFGRDVMYQFLTVEANYNGAQSWGASALVGELAAGDGFYSPEEGSAIVMKCIVGAYYGDAKVGRQDLVSKETTVDGKAAWLTESHLTFDIKGLKAKGELVIVLIVQTSAESSSIFYGSIPDNAKEHEATVRDSMAKLKVGG